MKKTIKLILILFVFILFSGNTCKADVGEIEDINKNYDYVINNYDIDMIVNENNTFEITETITVNYNVPKHGIFRKIPLKNSITRLDGTKSKNKAQITNISVNENYTTYNENGYKIIKIGKADETITGNKTYTIKYTYNIGKDPVENADELYFNLIGEEWDTTINNSSFKITMPKTFDKSLLGFSNGKIGSTDDSNIKYEVTGNTISGTLDNTINPGEALTVRLSLPDKYFIDAGLKIDKFSIIVIVICIICILISLSMWAKYGKDETVIETVEFYPPEGYNSAEVGFLYDGKASNRTIISLLIYLADKGYLKIEEMEQKILFSKLKGFKITKFKKYDGNNECERIFFNGLFKNSSIIKEDVETGEKKEFVTNTDLYNSFYITLDELKSKFNSKENKNKIFEQSAGKKIIWLILMIIVIFILITIKPIIEYSEDGVGMLPIAILFPGIGFTFVLSMFFNKNSKASKIFALIWGLLFGGVPWAGIVLPCLLQNMVYFITYLIGLISIAIIVIFTKIMPKRTPYGIEMLGKVKGFKNFLETAEKEQLEKLVMKNPEYFYNILPYTYALGVSDVWINQFESIGIKAPDWYDSNNDFNVHTFGLFMSSTMASAVTTMSSAPASSDDSGFSGGGSSGGGSGGGGGGSW